MLNFAFFCSVFCSTAWLIYAGMYVRSVALDGGLFAQSPDIMLSYLAIALLPILLVWLVFGFINQYLSNQANSQKQTELLRQLQKNQDYTDLVVRVMLEAEHEIKDGFVINKFDTFIADMNESLSDIIQRCNIASSAQLEQLWLKVQRGEKWALGKAIIEAAKNQSTFNAWMEEKVGRDKVFRGSLLEFCSRYQNLLQLLEKHDRDRVFLRVIETGVFGKVYSIIAPISEGLRTTLEPQKTDKESKRDYSSVLQIATMEEPKAPESIVNVDKDVEEQENDDLSVYAPKESFFSRLNPFKKNDDYLEHDTADDPFFKALHNSFSDNPFDEVKPSKLTMTDKSEPEPEIKIEEPKKEEISFGSFASTLQSLRATNESIEKNLSNNEPRLSAEADYSAEPKLSAEQEEKESNFVYPFGGWTDEENYKR